MALIKFGGGVAGASGKVAGTVYARNRAGAYQRNWAKPTNPVTPLQSTARANLSAAVTGWQSLTAAQVDAWNAYASTMTRLNRLGDSYVPTGRQIYIESFSNQRLVGIAPLTLPGPTTVAPSQSGTLITAAAATAGLFTSLIIHATSVNLPSGQDPTDAYVVIYGAPAHSAQKNNVNKQRRVLSTQDCSEFVTGTSIHAAYNAYFGATATDGLVIDLWAKVVDTLTGMASPFSKQSHVVV